MPLPQELVPKVISWVDTGASVQGAWQGLRTRGWPGGGQEEQRHSETPAPLYRSPCHCCGTGSPRGSPPTTPGEGEYLTDGV